MRRQGQDVMQVNLAGIRRDIVNLAHNYSNAQVIKIIICYWVVIYYILKQNAYYIYRKLYVKPLVMILGVQAVHLWQKLLI